MKWMENGTSSFAPCCAVSTMLSINDNNNANHYAELDPCVTCSRTSCNIKCPHWKPRWKPIERRTRKTKKYAKKVQRDFRQIRPKVRI